MSDLLMRTTEFATTLLDLIAVLIVTFGTLEAIYYLIRFIFGGEDDNEARRLLWLRYARWLVAALTFQLAADILETSIARLGHGRTTRRDRPDPDLPQLLPRAGSHRNPRSPARAASTKERPQGRTGLRGTARR
jgi:uncharacterized membrane protein